MSAAELTATYRLPGDAAGRLDELVAGIERNPGKMVEPAEIAELQELVDLRRVSAALPPGLSEDDFVGILRLALLTECATDTYAAAISGRARRYGAGWLATFTERVWAPDEHTHHLPYRGMLLDLGFSADDLDRDIADAQERRLEHRSGDTPAHLTTYAMIQEYVTDRWHGLIAGLLRQRAPEAATMAHWIKRRETLHTIWYRDMTALQLEANPALLRHIAEAAAHFHMPGKSIAPELETHVPRWLALMGADVEQAARDLSRHLYDVVRDTRTAGELLVSIAAEKRIAIGPLPAPAVRAALNRLGGPGYGLLGEALLERVGLGYLFAPRQAGGTHEPLSGRLRGMLRTWIGGQIDLSLAGAPE